MPTSNSPAALTQHIEDLLQDRQNHVEAIATIDAILTRVSTALGSKVAMSSLKSPGASTSGRGESSPKGKRRRRSRKFGMTGDDSILAFIEQEGNPTSRDIEMHWTADGRGGAAANALTRMVQQKKLKRTSLGKGVRGSRYSLA